MKSIIDSTIPDIQTTNKDRILQLYLELNELSAMLLNQIKTNAPGDIYYTFTQFRQDMFELYNASHRYRNFRKELAVDFIRWRNVNVSGRPGTNMLMWSLALYNNMIDELVRIEVLEL